MRKRQINAPPDRPRHPVPSIARNCCNHHGCLKLSFGAATCSVDRLCPEAKLLRWKRTPRENYEARRSLYPPLAGDRSNGRPALQQEVKSSFDAMGDGPTGAKADKGGCSHPGQQDGADRLGFDDKGRKPRSGKSVLRRVQKTRSFVWNLICGLYHGQRQSVKGRNQRPEHMLATDQTVKTPKFSLPNIDRPHRSQTYRRNNRGATVATFASHSNGASRKACTSPAILGLSGGAFTQEVSVI